MLACVLYVIVALGAAIGMISWMLYKILTDTEEKRERERKLEREKSENIARTAWFVAANEFGMELDEEAFRKLYGCELYV